MCIYLRQALKAQCATGIIITLSVNTTDEVLKKHLSLLQAKTVLWIFTPYFAAENPAYLNANIYLGNLCVVNRKNSNRKIVMIIYLVVDRPLFLKATVLKSSVCFEAMRE